MEEENKNNIDKPISKKAIVIGVILLIVAIIALFAAISNMTSSDKDKGGSSSIIEQITYRDLKTSDISVSYDHSNLTRVVVTIQANTDIKEFSASVYLYDENDNVIDSQNVSYSNMSSGSRYEVVFNLALSESWNLDSYQVKNIRGKARK